MEESSRTFIGFGESIIEACQETTVNSLIEHMNTLKDKGFGDMPVRVLSNKTENGGCHVYKIHSISTGESRELPVVALIPLDETRLQQIIEEIAHEKRLKEVN